MPRNASGIYVPPAGTQVVPNTLADAGKVESRLSDMGTEISASMPLSGLRPMQAPLLSVTGSAAAPGFAFAGDSSSGMAVISGRTSLVRGGVAGISTSATDVQAHLPMTVQALTVAGTLTAPGVVPPGAVMDFAGPSAPTGWLLCNGQAVSRTTYAGLFAAIGTYHGAGDGSSTFNLPDYRGRIGVGLDNMGGPDAARMVSQGAARVTLGAASGADTAGLAEANLPPHAHPNVPTQVVVPMENWGVGHNPLGAGPVGRIVTATGQTEKDEVLNSLGVAIVNQTVNLTGNTNTGSIGSGAPHLNVQPTLFVFKIIKT